MRRERERKVGRTLFPRFPACYRFKEFKEFKETLKNLVGPIGLAGSTKCKRGRKEGRTALTSRKTYFKTGG